MKMGGTPPTIRQPANFKKALQRLKETGKLSLDDFANASDIGAFIDFFNDTLNKKKDEYAQNEILEISKLLAKLMTSKTIVIKAPKGDKI